MLVQAHPAVFEHVIASKFRQNNEVAVKWAVMTTGEAGTLVG